MKVKVNYGEPDTRVCDSCMKDIDIDNENHFHSTDDNYLCFECGEAVLSLKFEEEYYSYIDYNVFAKYDESSNYGYEEYWKFEGKE